MSEPRVFAVAPSVPAPAMCGVKLTAGKLYPVLAETEAMFDIIDDTGSQVPCFWEECGFLAGGNWIRAVLDDEPEQGDGWQPIETAPKDGTEVLIWRADQGTMLARFGQAAEFMTDREIEVSSESAEWLYQDDWFAADFAQGCRLEGDLAPTHWTPLPSAPSQIEEGKDNG